MKKGLKEGLEKGKKEGDVCRPEIQSERYTNLGALKVLTFFCRGVLFSLTAMGPAPHRGRGGDVGFASLSLDGASRQALDQLLLEEEDHEDDGDGGGDGGG